MSEAIKSTQPIQAVKKALLSITPKRSSQPRSKSTSRRSKSRSSQGSNTPEKEVYQRASRRSSSGNQANRSLSARSCPSSPSHSLSTSRRASTGSGNSRPRSPMPHSPMNLLGGSPQKTKKRLPVAFEPIPESPRFTDNDEDNQSSAASPRQPQLVSPEHQLATPWVLWYHDDPKDWSLASYKQLHEFDTIEDFWALYNNLPPVANSMYFLMRKGHPPIWEVPENRQGGSWGFKFPKKVADKHWLEFSIFLIGETMANDTSQLIGLSISPKIYNVTVKIWNKNSDLVRDVVEFREEILRHKPIYKEFRDHKD